jgi:hypothetical protein
MGTRKRDLGLDLETDGLENLNWDGRNGSWTQRERARGGTPLVEERRPVVLVMGMILIVTGVVELETENLRNAVSWNGELETECLGHGMTLVLGVVMCCTGCWRKGATGGRELVLGMGWERDPGGWTVLGTF